MLSVEQQDIIAANDFAYGYHKNNLRKYEIKGIYLPEFSHLMQVQSAIWKWGAGTVTNMKAAINHDIRENTACDPSQLERVIGYEAALIVGELTFLPYGSTVDPTAKSKQDYLAAFSTKSVNALVIKLADRICNVLDFYQFDPAYAVTYFHKADVLFETFYNRYREVQDAFGADTYDNITRSIRNLETMLHKGTVTFE